MGVLENLEPKKVWTIFEQICQVPHPSKKEGKIIEFLMNFAAENGLEAKKDELGNILMIGNSWSRRRYGSCCSFGYSYR